jgi:hypothetical protein
MPLDDTNWSKTVETDETTELLIRARGFIERGWCRGVLARDETGISEVDPTSARTVAWCIYGAMDAAGVPVDSSHPAYRRLMGAIGGECVADFNNRQETVEPVLAAFDRAIAAVVPAEPQTSNSHDDRTRPRRERRATR